MSLAIGTREIEPRVLAQQGAFTIHADNSNLAFSPTSASCWGRAFIVPKEAKSDVRIWLRRLGFNKSTLFPDLGALAEDLKERFIEG